MVDFWRKDMDGGSEILGEAYLKLDPASAAKARSHIRVWLGSDHPEYENARLATSELVTNAVLHAFLRGPDALILLTLTRRAGLLYVEVTDPGGGFWDPYALPAMPDDEEGGRGLAIVGEVSRGRWGVRDRGRRGRTVWCALGGDPDPAERP
ncbi:ATP-binding protein [Streptosporangium sp. NPDC051022]|uniref:ATP-binding protein n=1 Tax=Streptosporangium sp. NPDC051022 TaxID=3155752 RepID=UPI0034233C8A